MKRRIIVPLMVGLLLLMMGVAAAACDDDEETENGIAPPTEVTPQATPEPSPEATPEPMPENGSADGTTPASETAAPEDTDGAEPDTSYSEDDVEYKLASIDEGAPVDLDSPLIDAYAFLLDRLDTKCEEDRSLIGDQAVRATQLLADEGIAVTALRALQGIDGSIPDESGTFSCAEVAATWITLVVAQ